MAMMQHCTAASNMSGEILLKMQQCCPIEAANAEILHQMQQSQT
ncbi:hypothetical protein MHI24_18405 [Paenibacillus sp. FSL K6-1096]